MRGNRLDRLSLPYLVLWINLSFFAVAAEITIQEREHKPNKIYSIPVLLCKRDELGTGKRASGD